MVKFGTVIGFLEEEFAEAQETGVSTIQLRVYCTPENLTDEQAELAKKLCDKYNLEISALWCFWPGWAVWNSYDGYETLGLVPVSTRAERVKSMMLGSDFAKKLGVEDIITHVGFIPENPLSAEYNSLIPYLRMIGNHCAANNQHFLFETGQETPMTLLRTFEDVNTGNMGVNLDPANLIGYGKGNPVDAMDVFGKYVRGVHIKDAVPPVCGRKNGKQTKVGEGSVNFPVLMKKLKDVGYNGPFTLEREIADKEQRIQDNKEAIKYITDIWESL